MMLRLFLALGLCLSAGAAQAAMTSTPTPQTQVLSAPTDRRALAQSLRTRRVYLALTPAAAAGRAEGAQAAPVAVRAVVLEDGELAVSVYTSPDRLRQALGPEAGFLMLAEGEVLRLFASQPLAVDYGSRGEALFRPRDIEALQSPAPSN